MRRDGVKIAKDRMKFKRPKMDKKNGCISCTCQAPYSDAKYGRIVHLVMKDKKIIQDYLTAHQEAVKNGNWNTMQEPLRNIQTNVRN